MGSGKTYEVVSSVILPAVKGGRDVVTNIYGLNEARVHAHLGKPDPGCEFGHIRIVENEAVTLPEFFPRSETDPDSIVRPGDLVAIDEAWRFWGSNKWPSEHMIFFREHRHYVNSKGVSCDLALMVQDITDLDKRLKNVVEVSFQFTKLKSLGLKGRYRVEIYEGSKLYKSKRSSWSSKTYNPKIFPLYKSYANESGQGVEKAIDSRQNFLKSGAFLVPLVLAVVLIGAGAWALTAFFNPERFKKPDEVPPVAAGADAGKKPAPALPAASVGASPAPSASVLPVGGSGASGEFSISGSVRIGSDDWVVISTPDGLRINSPSAVYSRGVSAVTKDEKKAVPAYLNR